MKKFIYTNFTFEEGFYMNLEEITCRQDLVLKLLEGGLFGGDIRVVAVTKDDLLFNAKDCALILEYKKTRNAIKQHVLEENKIKLRPSNFLTPQNRALENNSGALKLPNRGAIFLTEQGLYQLINGSKMPKAKDFQRWVGEVLTTFRKTGKYDKDDFAKSKFAKTLKEVPGYTEDETFKHMCTVQVQKLAKEKHQLTGVIWKRVTQIFFEHFGINVLREITKTTKQLKLKKRPNIREFLDAAGYHLQTYIAFEILRHDDNIKTNAEMLTYVLAYVQLQYAKLDEIERAEVRAKFLKLFEKGILKPAADYEIIANYKELEDGKSSFTFKD
jgi:prophage antirepressor-like protein